MSTSNIRFENGLYDFTTQMTTTHTKGAVFSGIRTNRICNITIMLTLTSNVNAYGTVCTIPSGFRPRVQQVFIAEGMDVTASGNIRSTTSRSSGSTISFSVCYIAE